MKIKAKNGTDSSGFSLIELLAATVILVMVVLIASVIFHQSSLAWDSGLRKAQGSMSGRAIVGLICRELQGAVADTVIFKDNSYTAKSITFATLNKAPATGTRIARQITYAFAKPCITRSTSTKDDYKSGWVAETSATIADGIDDLTFTYPAGALPPYSLPNWVRVELKLIRKGDVSGVGAKSAGPDGNIGTSDDIRSW